VSSRVVGRRLPRLAPPPTGGPYSLNFDVESSELSNVPTQHKPLWLGEFSQGAGFSTFDVVEQGGAIDAALNPAANGF